MMERYVDKKIFRRVRKIAAFAIICLFILTGIPSSILITTVKADLSSGLVAYWSFDEGSGSTAHDYSGNGNDGTIYGASWTIDTPSGSGYALSFDGVDDYVDITDTSDFMFVDHSLTFCAWIEIVDNPNQYRGFINLIDKEPGSDRPVIGLAKWRSGNHDGRLYFEVINETTTHNVVSNLNGNDLPKNEWMFVVGVADKENNEIKLYVNGALQGDVKEYLPYDFSGSVNLKLFIGKLGFDNWPGYHKGLIDEARIYNRALSESEIQQLYSQGGEENIIFSDDFNDNTKDYSKWTEIFASGTWWERNQRAEFKLYENLDQGERFEGIESNSFTAFISPSQDITISVDMISDISHENGQFVGYLHLEVTDGTNWIRVSYRRGTDDLQIQDSNDPSETIIGNRNDGTWSNKIQIFSNKYKVTMGSYDSGWVYDSLFSGSPALKVRIYIQLGGSSDLWWTAGFDNVLVQGQSDNQPPNKPVCSYDKITDELVITATDPDNDNVRYDIDWNNDGIADQFTDFVPSGTPQEVDCHGRKGIVKVCAEDSHGATSGWIQVKPKNKVVNLLLLQFLENHPHLFPLLRHLWRIA